MADNRIKPIFYKVKNNAAYMPAALISLKTILFQDVALKTTGVDLF